MLNLDISFYTGVFISANELGLNNLICILIHRGVGYSWKKVERKAGYFLAADNALSPRAEVNYNFRWYCMHSVGKRRWNLISPRRDVHAQFCLQLLSREFIDYFAIRSANVQFLVGRYDLFRRFSGPRKLKSVRHYLRRVRI